MCPCVRYMQIHMHAGIYTLCVCVCLCACVCVHSLCAGIACVCIRAGYRQVPEHTQGLCVCVCRACGCARCVLRLS